MKKNLILFIICLTLTGNLWAEDIVFPAAAEGKGFVDITKSPYNADITGVIDATSAIQSAVNTINGSGKTIYFPNGTYLISKTIAYPNLSNGQLPRFIKMQGQSEAGVVWKLKNSCSGFTNPSSPKAMLETGHDVAQCFGMAVKNMTFNTGTGNAGAIGLRFYSNNSGTAKYITIVSGDGNGAIGLDLFWQNENGPLFCKNITVNGFNIGVNTGSCQNSQTIEHLTLLNQKQYGIKTSGGVLNIRDLVSTNSVQAVNNTGVLTIIGATCNGGSSSTAAMSNTNVLYVRSLSASGYARGIDNSGGNKQSVAALTSAEWSSHDQISQNTSQPGMLKLPINETPEIIWDDPSQWQVVTNPGVGVDATAAIQAAIDAGKTTVYFENKGKTYTIKGKIYVRGNVRTLFGFGVNLDVIDDKGETPSAGFVVQDGTAPVVVFEDFQGGYEGWYWVQQQSTRSVAVKNVLNWGVQKSAGSGDLYLEDICAHPWTWFEFNGGNVWARQLNTECRISTKIVSTATNLWILGLKTEWGQSGATIIDTKGGGQTEVCGFLSYDVTDPGTLPMFIVNESKFSAVGTENSWGAVYTNIVQETIDGVTKTLQASSLPKACGNARQLPYYVCNPGLGVAPIAVTSVTVAPTSATISAGGTVALTATVLPTNAVNKKVTWTTSDLAIAMVNASGVVTGVANGSATITVTTADGGKTATFAVTVAVIAVTGISVAPTTATIGIGIGGTQALTASVMPTNASDKGVTWTTSNASIATVSMEGIVTGVAAGVVTITGTTVNGGFTATSTITVTASIYHTIKLENVSGFWTFIDKFEIFNGSTWTAVNQNNTSITYTGSWTAENYCTDWKCTNGADNSASLTFTGTGIRWYNCDDDSKTRVYIDGVLDATINIGTPTNCGGIAYEKTGLSGPVTGVTVSPTAASSAIKVSPNPASDILKIDFCAQFDKASIEVYDMQGRLVLQSVVSNSKLESIDISRFSTGIYMLNINNGYKLFNARFVKK